MCAAALTTLMVMALTVVGGVLMDSSCHCPMQIIAVSNSVNEYIMHVNSLILCAVCNDGDLRIVGNSSTEGSVEICINNSYGAICDDFWDVLDARVACMQLGFTNGTYLKIVGTESSIYLLLYQILSL